MTLNATPPNVSLCVTAANRRQDKDMAVMLDHSVAVKEMEAGSVAWAAQLFGKPLLCIKVCRSRPPFKPCMQPRMAGVLPCETGRNFIGNIRSCAASLPRRH
jgi:hypothetical protein